MSEWTVFPNKSLAIRAGEASRQNYTVEPVGERNPSKEWRLRVEPRGWRPPPAPHPTSSPGE